MPKNVTPNCSMLDLILVYFKSIDVVFDNLEKVLNIECGSQQLPIDHEVGELIQSKIVEIDKDNLMKKIFSLKDISECENEANI